MIIGVGGQLHSKALGKAWPAAPDAALYDVLGAVDNCKLTGSKPQETAGRGQGPGWVRGSGPTQRRSIAPVSSMAFLAPPTLYI